MKWSLRGHRVLTLCLAATALAGTVLTAAPASAATLAVNTTDDLNFGVCDAFHCSLREAIRDANLEPGLDTISFNIPGAGTHTIQPASQLPLIDDPVVIDGTTQPGFAGTPIVEIDGSKVSTPPDKAPGGIAVTAGGSTIMGLVVNRFPSAYSGISLGGGANIVQGNYIGTDVTGSLARGNAGAGVVVASNGNLVGGTTAAARNVISANSRSGILITSTAKSNQVQGNYIGTNASGTAALANGASGQEGGIKVSGSERNQIGGRAPGAGNLVSGNAHFGIGIFAVPVGPGQPTAIPSKDNRVQGNLIGTDVSGTGALGNAGPGVLLQDSFGNSVGGTVGNTIAFNTKGIVLGPDTLADDFNSFRRNAIFSNTGLGIDLNNDGVTVNDGGDPDSGPNFLQNYPVLTGAVRNGNAFDLAGTLNSTASTTFLLEFYSNPGCDPLGFGEGQRYLGAALATSDGGGNASFNASFAAPVVSDRWFTATATGPGGSTSEFSQCKQRPTTADLAIDKTDSADPVGVGETFAYHLLVTMSRGGETANGVSVDDQIPDALLIQSATPSRGDCTIDRQMVHCDLGGGSRLNVTIDILVQTTEHGGLTNTATVSSTSFDPRPENNVDTEETFVE